jgi:uncharacterized protein with HEPN domain
VKNDRIFLEHISECLRWIEEYLAEGGRETFFSDRKTQSAVLRELQTLAESTQRLSVELKEIHQGVYWRGISGFRNILAHDYLGIKLERVWDVIERDLPPLKQVVNSILGKFDKKQDC